MFCQLLEDCIVNQNCTIGVQEGGTRECRDGPQYDYVRDRLQGQMKYYSKTCKKLQNQYRWFSIANIIIAAIIPIFSLAVDSIGVVAQYIIAVLGAAASITSGIVFFEKYRDRWLQGRITQEKLKSELAKYRSGTCHYAGLDADDKLNLLVEACESYMENEHSEWREIMSKEK